MTDKKCEFYDTCSHHLEGQICVPSNCDVYKWQTKTVHKIPIPDFDSMKLELLLSTPSQGKDCSPYNNALWLAKENRLKKLGIACATDLDDLEANHEWLTAEFEALQVKFARLVTLIESNGLLEIPKVKLEDYLEGRLE